MLVAGTSAMSFTVLQLPRIGKFPAMTGGVHMCLLQLLEECQKASSKPLSQQDLEAEVTRVGGRPAQQQQTAAGT